MGLKEIVLAASALGVAGCGGGLPPAPTPAPHYTACHLDDSGRSYEDETLAIDKLRSPERHVTRTVQRDISSNALSTARDSLIEDIRSRTSAEIVARLDSVGRKVLSDKGSGLRLVVDPGTVARGYFHPAMTLGALNERYENLRDGEVVALFGSYDGKPAIFLNPLRDSVDERAVRRQIVHEEVHEYILMLKRQGLLVCNLMDDAYCNAAEEGVARFIERGGALERPSYLSLASRGNRPLGVVTVRMMHAGEAYDEVGGLFGLVADQHTDLASAVLDFIPRAKDYLSGKCSVGPLRPENE